MDRDPAPLQRSRYGYLINCVLNCAQLPILNSSQCRGRLLATPTCTLCTLNLTHEARFCMIMFAKTFNEAGADCSQNTDTDSETAATKTF